MSDVRGVACRCVNDIADTFGVKENWNASGCKERSQTVNSGNQSATMIDLESLSTAQIDRKCAKWPSRHQYTQRFKKVVPAHERSSPWRSSHRFWGIDYALNIGTFESNIFSRSKVEG